MAERGRGPGAFTVACGAGRAVLQAWHNEQRVERDRYAGLLAAGVTDAATLEPPAPVPARRVEVARATQVALPVWLAVPGAAARPVVLALPVLPTAMRAADVRAAGVLAPAVAGPGSDVLAPAELTEAQLVALSDAAEAAAAIASGPRTYWTGVRAAELQAARPREATAKSQPWINTTNSFFELFLRTTAKPADWVVGTGPTKEQTLEFANFMCNTRRRRSLKDPTRKGCGSTS